MSIINLAREAGFPDWWISPPEPERQDGNALDMLARLVELAKSEEREACAKVCDNADKSAHPSDLADAIRARSKE